VLHLDLAAIEAVLPPAAAPPPGRGSAPATPRRR
jgi:hypothetical protein